MPIAWWVGGRRGKAGHSSGGHHGPAGMSAAGDPDEVDGKEPMQTTEPESSVPVSPAWHPTMRKTASVAARSEEHTSELQSLMRISSAVLCLKKTNNSHDYSRLHRHQNSKT